MQQHAESRALQQQTASTGGHQMPGTIASAPPTVHVPLNVTTPQAFSIRSRSSLLFGHLRVH